MDQTLPVFVIPEGHGAAIQVTWAGHVGRSINPPADEGNHPMN
jgi:hypothetical protein